MRVSNIGGSTNFKGIWVYRPKSEGYYDHNKNAIVHDCDIIYYGFKGEDYTQATYVQRCADFYHSHREPSDNPNKPDDIYEGPTTMGKQLNVYRSEFEERTGIYLDGPSPSAYAKTLYKPIFYNTPAVAEILRESGVGR